MRFFHSSPLLLVKGRLAERDRRAFTVVAHGCLVIATLLLLSSLAGAAVIAAPVLAPLLIIAWRNSRGPLRWLYTLLLAVLAVEVFWTLANVIGGDNRTPATPR